MAASTPPADDGQAVMWRYRDVENVLGVCERTVRRMVRRGELQPPALIGPGRRLGWPADVVQSWLDARRGA